MTDRIQQARTEHAHVATCLWYDGQAMEAAQHYVSLVPGSEITSTASDGEDGVVMVEFTLAGAPYTALNGGPQHHFTEAVSVQVTLPDQESADRLWDALTRDGGEEGPCGWCKDRFGLSWQVIPQGLPELLTGADPEANMRAVQAMQTQTRIDLAAIRAARDGA